MGLRGSLEYRFCCIYYLCFVFVFVLIFAFTLAFVVVVVVFPTTEFGGFRSWWRSIAAMHRTSLMRWLYMYCTWMISLYIYICKYTHVVTYAYLYIYTHTYASIYKHIDIDIDIGPTVVTELTNTIDLDRHPTSWQRFGHFGSAKNVAMYWLVIPVAWGISGPVVEKSVPTPFI